ncbi:hypothetical protein DKT74_14270 [Streptomyces sp. ZEA17I]|uniref:DUF5753 domain-containing protein n=1 Tax=Streptomyces sp. ZEA17I TaxID=2202516 RepID=UPI000D6F0E0E|nr:DUF5753 domain-containing protein [Streptomyces sp. ZEA17I]PWS43901.1 hypothetical protein DKT74_14270 [Streptomyces sp. ZEA17I]
MPVTDPQSLDEHLDRLLALETAADHIHGWHPTLMPGMLQTADYARAAIRASAPALPPHDVEAIAAARLTRIDTLGQAAGRRARFVISEDVLTKAVGGPVVHAQQLAHLLTLVALRPSLEVRVLPATTDAHAGLAGEFTMYSVAGRRSVFVETLMGGTIIDRVERALLYAHAWDDLQGRAASPAASLEMIEAARSALVQA